MKMRDLIGLCEATEHENADSLGPNTLTASFMKRAYAAVLAMPSADVVGLHLEDDHIFGFTDLPNMVEINNIEVDDEARFEGIGSAVMRILCALADTMGVTLVLRIWDSDELDLDAWYSRFGFEGSRTMFRKPKSSTVPDRTML